LLCRRLREARVNFAVYMGDLTRAFPSVRYPDMAIAMQQQCNKRGLQFWIERRHEGVHYCVKDSNGYSKTVRAASGIVTGESLGPYVFVLVYNLLVADGRTQGGLPESTPGL
jgi:hypothetical protein